MNNTENRFNALNAGVNKLFVDLIFDLAAGECFKAGCTYEEQLEYFVLQILPDHASIEDFIEFGQKYRLSSKYMFPGKPDRIKNRGLLMMLFSSFAVLKEMYDCDSLEIVSDYTRMLDSLTDKFAISDENDLLAYTKEVENLTRRYSELIDEGSYSYFMKVMSDVEEDFVNTYSRIVSYVLGDSEVVKTGLFAQLLELYHIPQSDATKFHLEVDAIAETAIIKNQQLTYEEEFESQWEKHFPQYKYSEEVEKYVKSKKSAFVLAYGNNISSIRNEKYLFLMLADVTVKLALVDGAKNDHELTQKIKELTAELGNNIKDTFIESRKSAARVYHLFSREDYPADLKDVLIPYRSDLMYLRDIIIEEISIRNADNIVQKQTRITKDASEYELLLSQKDAEIYDLKHELDYYENIKQQEFKAEVSQYNRALTDLFRKLCDFKFNSPLNELYLIAMGAKEASPESVRGTLQNFLFILSSMNIVPNEVANVGKRVRFYDDEANIVYAVDENKVKEGLNQGVQIYPGWKYKDTELVLPKVEIEED
ncbi:MAG: hypothetical protein IJ794_13335 [Lachnospiraceae bacterium]|nr:hypothetical protein [Lachnospiraceae bacterium]